MAKVVLDTMQYVIALSFVGTVIYIYIYPVRTKYKVCRNIVVINRNNNKCN